MTADGTDIQHCLGPNCGFPVCPCGCRDCEALRRIEGPVQKVGVGR